MSVLGAIAIVGGVSKVIGGQKQKKQAKKERNLEVQRIRAQTAEEIRRRTASHKRDVSAGLATAGASGFGGGPESGGYSTVLKAMEDEFSAEVDWMNKAAASGIDVTNLAYESAKTSIGMDQAQAIIGGTTLFGQANGWWAL